MKARRNPSSAVPLSSLTPAMRAAYERAISDLPGSQPAAARHWKNLRTTSKYNASGVRIDGVYFPSKLEARRYGDLKLLMKAGEVQWFALQPVFVLPGGVIYRADFVICWKSGEATVEDAKGVDRQESRNKRKQVKAIYNGLEVQLWPQR